MTTKPARMTPEEFLSQLEECATQAEAAHLYFRALVHGVAYPDPWQEINEAIIKRWSLSGLKRIKRIVYGLHV